MCVCVDTVRLAMLEHGEYPTLENCFTIVSNHAAFENDAEVYCRTNIVIPVRNVKRTVYQRNKEHTTGEMCVMCQFEYENGDEVGTLPCEHAFHHTELHAWLARNPTCPLCRAPVE